MQTHLQKHKGPADPGPKKSQPKDVEGTTETREIVNGQSQTQVTNNRDVPAVETNESTTSEEEKDEKTNNLRDALNSDNMPLPTDEGDNGIVN